MKIITDPNVGILWMYGGTSRHDAELLKPMIAKYVSRDERHQEKCLDKIMTNIRTPAWQRKYKHRIFVFNVHYALSMPVIDLSFALSCQAIDALFFMLSPKLPIDKIRESFTDKVRFIFEEVYKKRMPIESARVLRIIRNDIMHTGEIMGIRGAKDPRDERRLQNYFKAHNTSSQQMTEVQHVIDLAGRFNWLVGDIALKVLGLDDSDIHGFPKVQELLYFT